ncbi:MAG: type I CRISPR-associated protein Cas7, partial [Candidatus Cloacimonadales bacterium]|nr:type I CRISPR-associated protein Cas7 [Candidatus Cloacimonadales bacterium]
FGGVIPLEKEKKGDKGEKGDKGDSITFTGPVQFKMGRSLHKVEMKHVKGTGAFASKVGAMQQTFREDYVLPYSLIAFYGIVNEKAAVHTKMTEDDYNLLIESIWEGTRNLITRSKMEHNPRLLLTLQHNKPQCFIGELDKHITLKINGDMRDEQIRDITDISIDMKALKERINTENTVATLKKDDRLTILNW